jgi:hypothetical protein
VRQIPPGEAQHSIARHRESPVAVAVGLESTAGAVRRAAIQFDDEASPRPEEVRDVVEQWHVRGGLGKAVAATEGKKALLEVVAGRRGAEPVLAEQVTEGAGTRPPEVNTDHLVQLLFIAEGQPLCLIDCPFELPAGKDSRQVEKSPGRGGNRNAATKSPLLCGQ